MEQLCTECKINSLYLTKMEHLPKYLRFYCVPHPHQTIAYLFAITLCLLLLGDIFLFSVFNNLQACSLQMNRTVLKTFEGGEFYSRIEMHQQQRTNVLQIATRKQSTSSPDLRLAVLQSKHRDHIYLKVTPS